MLILNKYKLFIEPIGKQNPTDFNTNLNQSDNGKII
jgi:hypothetical protein